MARPAPIALIGLTVVLTCAVATPQTAGSSAGSSWGRSAADLYLEDFLRTAEVVKIEDVGSGITRPKRLTLARDGITHHAIFKTVDFETTEISFTTKFESGFKDSYAFEVAAYRVDRLLGVGLVPVTILRTVGGETGSVQYWIENAMTMRDALEGGLQPRRPELLHARLMATYVLDAVIDNRDRNVGNMLIRPSTDELFLIDHSRSCTACKKLPELPNHRQDVTVPPKVAERLLALDDSALRASLDDVLSRQQIRAMCARRDRLERSLRERGLLPS